MCGISGVVNRERPADNTVLRAMAQRLTHRGPDEHGTYVDRRVGLAHTRLSIIDVAGGQQPLYSPDKNIVVVANGEIYNHVELRAELEARGHRFATHSDCETIVHAYAEYGLDCVDRLVGMFAFALYDRNAARVVLARDRLGIKPLFLARLTDGFAFTSELKALHALPGYQPQIDPQGLGQYLQTQFTSGRGTVLADVERVLPGEIVCLDSKDLTISRRQYWSARNIEPTDIDFATASRQFDDLMHTVMRQHMRTDVPYGLFLSGGVDSSVLLALLSRFSELPIRSFSVGFPKGQVADELPNAERMARDFDSDHSVLRPDPAEMLNRLPACVWAADELMQDFANLPTAMLAEHAGRELKVVFTGEGGDEVFAGYGRYRMPALERAARSLLARGTGGFRVRGIYRGAWPGRLFAPNLREAARHWRAPIVDAWGDTPDTWSTLQKMQYTDLVTALPDNLLVKVDRMLMGWGVEGRVPLLDHRVVEFGLALPDKLKIENRQGKAFLRRWAEAYLPKESLWRRKRGFYVPVGRWMQDSALLDRLAASLSDSAGVGTWFDTAGVKRLIAAQRSGGRHTRPLWTLLQFAVWHRLFIEGDGSRPAPDADPLTFIS